MSRLESQVGRVGSVDDVLAGSVLLDDHAAGESVLRVVDAADFSEAGGQVVVEGTVLAYTSADLATDVLTLVEPLAAWTESDTPAQVYPPAPTRVVAVEIDGSDEPLSAVVPQSLLDQLPLGLREIDAAETVTVALVDGQWTVRDLVAATDVTVKEGSFRQGHDGETTGGLREDGSADFTQVRAASYVVDGTDLGDMLGPKVDFLGRFSTAPGEVYGPKTVDLALIEVIVDCPANTTLILDARGQVRQDAGALSILRCSYTYSATGSPPRPGGGDTEITPGLPVMHHTSWSGVNWGWSLGIGSEDVRVRALVWVYRDPSGGDVSARDFTVLAYRARVRGASGFAGVVRAAPGAGGSTPMPPPPPATRTETYDLGPHSLWTQSGTRVEWGTRTQDVQAGRVNSSLLLDTLILIPPTGRAAIAAAEDLVAGRMRLAASQTPRAPIRPSIGTVQSANIGGSTKPAVRNIHPGSRTYGAQEPSGWTDLNGATLTALKAGDPGLIITYPSSSVPVGRFHGPGASGALRPQIELTLRSRT